MDGLHVEGMPEHESESLGLAEIGDPVPAEETLDGDRQVLSIGLEGSEKLLTVAGELAMEEDLASRVKNADVETAGVEVDTTVVPMLLGVESHPEASLVRVLTHSTAYRVGKLEGASISIPGFHRTSNALRASSACEALKRSPVV
jgi:hypothetical protein